MFAGHNPGRRNFARIVEVTRGALALERGVQDGVRSSQLVENGRTGASGSDVAAAVPVTAIPMPLRLHEIGDTVLQAFALAEVGIRDVAGCAGDLDRLAGGGRLLGEWNGSDPAFHELLRGGGELQHGEVDPFHGAIADALDG